MKTYSDKEIMDALRRRQGEKSYRAFAKEIGVSYAHLREVMIGTRSPGQKFLDYLGLRSAIIPKSKTA